MRIDLKTQKISNQGFSLLEVVLSLGIFAILVTAVTSLALSSFSFFSYGQSYDRAEELATEAEVAVRAIGAEAFDELIAGSFVIGISDGQWALDSGGTVELIDGLYSRTIRILPVYRDTGRALVAFDAPDKIEDIYSKFVEISIAWKSDRDIEQSISRTILLADWRNARCLATPVATTTATTTEIAPDASVGYWLQNNWQGGDGQILNFEDVTRYGLSENLETASSPFLSITRTDGIYADSGYLKSSPFFATSGQFMNVSWDASTSCPGCLVKVWIEVAESIGEGMAGSWLPVKPIDQPDENIDFFSTSSGSIIGLIPDTKSQWIRYTVQLEGDGTATPILNSISISYKKE